MNKTAMFYIFIFGFLSSVLSKAPFLLLGILLLIFGSSNKLMLLIGLTLIISVFLYALILQIWIMHVISKSEHPFINIVRGSIVSGESLYDYIQSDEMKLAGEDITIYEDLNLQEKEIADKIADEITDYIRRSKDEGVGMFVVDINSAANELESLVLDISAFSKEQLRIVLRSPGYKKRGFFDGNKYSIIENTPDLRVMIDQWCDQLLSDEENSGVEFSYRFPGLLVKAIQTVHDRRSISECYGRELPIVIVDTLTRGNALNEINLRANGAELLEEAINETDKDESGL